MSAYKFDDAQHLKNIYEQNGYVIIRKLIPKNYMQNMEDIFRHLLIMQLQKIEKVSEGRSTDELVVRLDTLSHTALHAVGIMLRNTSEACQMMGTGTICAYASALTNAQSPLVLSGPALFINQPGKTTRKYTAHAEQNWYPKRQNFTNIWIPFIRNRKSSETMRIWKGSHQKDWFRFTEYTGYGESKNKLDNVQYEIPNRYLKDYEPEFLPDMEIGDAVFFSPKLVHASVDLKEADNSYAFTIRAFDYTNDLTLSSNWAEVPYANDTLSSFGLFTNDD